MSAAEPAPTPAEAALGPIDRFRGLAHVPRVARDAYRMVREAAPRLVRLCLSLQVLTAVVVGLQVLVVKELIIGLLNWAGKRTRRRRPSCPSCWRSWAPP